MMVQPYVLIIHEVAEYTLWKQIFDKASGIRKEAGEISYQILRFNNDPNLVVHFSLWSSHADAKVFFESELLVTIRKEAGVKQPKFIYLDQLEYGHLE